MMSRICETCGLELVDNPPFAKGAWLDIVYSTFRRLHDEVKPHQKYYHYKQDVCNFIDQNWTQLCGSKKRTKTWNNTVSAVITTHPRLFEPNHQANGYWTLKRLENGSLSVASSKKTGKSKKNKDDDEDGEEGSQHEPAEPPIIRVRRTGSSKKRSFSEMEAADEKDDLIPIPMAAAVSTPKRVKVEIPVHEGPFVPFSLRRRRKVPPFSFPLTGGLLREIGWSILRKKKPIAPPPPPLTAAPTQPVIIVANVIPTTSEEPNSTLSAANSSDHIQLTHVGTSQIIGDLASEGSANGSLPMTPVIAAPDAVQIVSEVDPYAPETYFAEDEYGIPLPPGWFDRTMKRYPQAQQIARAVRRAAAEEGRRALEGEIPLPTWRESNDVEDEIDIEQDEIEIVESSPDLPPHEEEDDSDAKYHGLHSYYESLERRIKKFN